VLEPARDDDVQRAVAVLVLPGDQHALLGIDELHRRGEDEVPHAAAFALLPAHGLQPLQLPSQLPVPLALGLPRRPQLLQQADLHVALLLQPAGVALELPAVLPLILARQGCRTTGVRGFGAGRAPAGRRRQGTQEQDAGADQCRRPQAGVRQQRHGEADRGEHHETGDEFRTAPWRRRLVCASGFRRIPSRTP
jgi:hypothetical protein